MSDYGEMKQRAGRTAPVQSWLSTPIVLKGAVSALARAEAENERLREGWMADKCFLLSCTSRYPIGSRGGWKDKSCARKCKYTRKDGDYCQVVKEAVDGK